MILSTGSNRVEQANKKDKQKKALSFQLTIAYHSVLAPRQQVSA